MGAGDRRRIGRPARRHRIGPVALKPGGAHIMISGLTAPLREGDDLKLTLRFERSGDRAVNFRVASATGTTGH